VLQFVTGPEGISRYTPMIDRITSKATCSQYILINHTRNGPMTNHKRQPAIKTLYLRFLKSAWALARSWAAAKHPSKRTNAAQAAAHDLARRESVALLRV